MTPSSSSSNGSEPVKSANKITPRDQMSTSVHGEHSSSVKGSVGVKKRERGTRRRTFSEVSLSGDDFGSHVAEGSDAGVHEATFFKLSAEPEVCNLYVDVLVEQDILQLEVSVDDAFAMEVRDAEDELGKDASGFGERESGLVLFDEVVEQFSAGAEFGDEVDGGFGRDEFKEREDVGVPEAAVVVDLAGQQGQRRRRIRRRVLRARARLGLDAGSLNTRRVIGEKGLTEGKLFGTCLMATLVPVRRCTPSRTFPKVPANTGVAVVQ